MLNNDATFAISSSYNVNVPTAALPGNGQVFVIGTGGGQLSVPSGAILIFDDGSGAGVAATNAELQGSGDLTKIGGVLSLGNGTSNFSNYTGQIFIDAGTVSMGNGGTFQLGATSAGTFVNAGGTLDLNDAEHRRWASYNQWRVSTEQRHCRHDRRCAPGTAPAMPPPPPGQSR